MTWKGSALNEIYVSTPLFFSRNVKINVHTVQLVPSQPEFSKVLPSISEQ